MLRALRIGLAGVLAAVMIFGCAPKAEIEEQPVVQDAQVTPPAPGEAGTTDAVQTNAPATAPATDATTTTPAPAETSETH